MVKRVLHVKNCTICFEAASVPIVCKRKRQLALCTCPRIVAVGGTGSQTIGDAVDAVRTADAEWLKVYAAKGLDASPKLH